MGTLINSTALTFNGGVSTADQFSQLFTSAAIGADYTAFLFQASWTAGDLVVTLQGNPDIPSTDTLFGWLDLATPDTKVFHFETQSFLPQKHASIGSGLLRGGAIEGGTSGSGTYLLQFAPFFRGLTYRLRFQIDATSVFTVDRIMTLP